MIRLVGIFICALLLSGCGVKGNLKPKGKPVPAPPDRLILRQQGETVLLRWGIPNANQDGSPLTDLSGFRVDLYTYQPESYCPECRDQETVATIPIDSPEPAYIINRSVYFRTSAVDHGVGVRYRVRSLTPHQVETPAAEARLQIMVPPPAPTGVMIEALDRGVRLFWKIPGSAQEAGELLGVNLYRDEVGTGLNPEPLTAQPLTGNNFEDFGLENGQNYRYGLRTVVRIGETVVESALSEIVEATPEAGL